MTTNDTNTTDRHGIIVGVDGSDASQAALEWAAARTDQFGPVRPVHSWDYPISVWAPSPFGPGMAPPANEMAAAAQEAADKLVADLGDDIPHEAPIVEHGDAGSVLVEAARDAELLVVGTRGRGPVRANVIGSVARHCADHTPVPLVIVPHHDELVPAGPSERIVVGVDGSDSSLAALRWAIENAPADATISAISAWQTPVDGPILYGVNRFDLKALRAAAQATVNEAADRVCGELGVDGSRVIREIAEGDPRWVLLTQSETADLLVLGQRGRTGLSHFFLGSTTTALVHRPHCPTAVIPG
ncbi:MAG: universal stress protein [Acidimicrobiales bacterium]